MNRRRFIKTGLLWLPTVVMAQDVVPFRHKQVANGLLNNLVHYYQLTESTAPFADSGSNPTSLNFTNSGQDFSRGTGHVQAFAAAYSGAASSNTIGTISAAGFDFSGDSTGNTSMTYMCWFNLSNTQTQSFPPIFSIWGSAASGQVILFRRDAANQVGIYTLNNALATVSLTPIAATDNNWHMFVGGHDHPNTTLWYQIDNGTRTTTTLATLHSINGTAFDIFNWAAGSNELHGLVSDVGIWNARVLSTTDVTTLWNGGAGLAFSQFTK